MKSPNPRGKSLAPGDRLGSYEVIRAIGAGGMGEVYRAFDTTLGREVALKVLHQPLAWDAERLARVDREARILASLNHPNIATIHGIVPSDAGPALVLELVDGPTLQDRLMHGPLPIEETLRYARQIADAIEAAHDQGVVHRDLKPGNIKIRPDGKVKVLDFGIAKIVAPAPRESAALPTLSATGPEALIGTASYMSPEQARGADVTHQADVWAFGAVLYEMLTGQRAFPGATTSDAIAAILHETPDWNLLPSSTPRAIGRLVRRCLEREPNARLHDIGDARLEIEDEERALYGETPPSGTQPAVRAASAWRGRALGFGAVIAIVAGALAAFVYPARDGEKPAEVRLPLLPPAGTRFISVPAVSPDGRSIVFVTTPVAGGGSQLWIRPLDARTPTPLAGTEGARFPFWSPDSRSVGFFAEDRLKRINLAGGAPIAICVAEVGRGGAWLDDDTIVFAPSQFSPLARVKASGGQPEPFTTLAEGEGGHRFPQRLPARQLLYFTQNRDVARNGTRLISVDDPGREIAFFTGNAVAEYVDGFLLFVRPPRLLAQRLSLPSGQLVGEPADVGGVRVSESFGRYVMSSASRVVVYQEPSETLGQFTWVSRDGRVLETVGEPDVRAGVELSPDGLRLATVKSEQIWTLEVARPVLSRATRATHRHPIWSPDGTRIATLVQGRGPGTFDIAVTTVATGVSATLLPRTNYVRPLAWTRDARTLVFIQAGFDKRPLNQIWTMPVSDPEHGEPYLHDGSNYVEARLSPDDRWMAYATDRSGRYEVEVREFPVPGARYPISVAGGGYPRWRADGRELYFVSAQSQLMAVPVTLGNPPAFGRPQPLFDVDLVVGHPDRGSIFTEYEYGVSVDGTRFLLNRRMSDGPSNLSVILNWAPGR